MSQQKKNDDLNINSNLANIRPALRNSAAGEKRDPDRTDNVRPPELGRPVVVPVPPQKTTQDKVIQLNEPTNDIPVGCFTFMRWMILQLEIVGIGQHIRVTPTHNQPLIIGRSPDSAPETIDVDLTRFVDPYDGVSRIHAAIKLEGTRLELVDKNSTNGTSLNYIRFNPNESHPIRSGDVIMLGHFHMVATFAPRLTSENTKDTNILSPMT